MVRKKRKRGAGQEFVLESLAGSTNRATHLRMFAAEFGLPLLIFEFHSLALQLPDKAARWFGP